MPARSFSYGLAFFRFTKYTQTMHMYIVALHEHLISSPFWAREHRIDWVFIPQLQPAFIPPENNFYRCRARASQPTQPSTQPAESSIIHVGI